MEATRKALILSELEERNITCLKQWFILGNNLNMNAFPLNLGNNQTLILAGWSLLYFHLQIHIMSCHVTYTAAALLVCGPVPLIHFPLVGLQRLRLHCKHMSLLLF